MKKIIISGLLAALVSTTAMADLTSDLSFGTGDFNGWTAGPTTYTQTGNYSGDGLGAATVTGTQTVSCCGSNVWAVNPYTGSYMVGLQPGNSSLNYSTMTTALGLSSASISALNTEINAQGTGQITSGVWITKNFTFTSPATFKMAWNYISTDYVPFNDGSLTSLVNTTNGTQLGKINGLSKEYLLLGATNPGTGNYSTGSYGSTGWQWVNYDIVTAGTYKLGFAAFNQLDTGLSPVLFVNDGLGTTTQNGTAFNPVAPNDPTMPTTNPDGTVSGGGTTPTTPTAPTVTGTTTTNTVTSSTANGTSVITNSIAYGVGAVVITNTNARGEQGAKTLTVAQNTANVTTTPFTITTTTTTPVTTTTTTTPVTTTTYSDNTTTTVNGTPVVTTNTTNTVAAVDTLGEEIVEIGTTQNYQTRIDQYDYLAKANQRVNQQLNSDVLDRQQASGDSVKPRSTLYGSEEKGWFYMNVDGQRSNTNGDGYKMSGQRFGVGFEKNIASNHLVGVQYNNYYGNLNGTNAGGSLEKNHVGLYSLYAKNDWIVKSDLGVAYNTFKNAHSIPELGLANTGATSGNDTWLSSRVYAPDTKGFRPYVGARVENNMRNGLTESGADVSAMTYGRVNSTTTSGEAGVRFDKELAGKVNFIAEAGTTTQNLTNYRAGVNYSPGKNVVGGVTVGQQQQNGVTNSVVQASLRIFF
jgi:hypothetical protein